jgi:subtilisin family serine protease
MAPAANLTCIKAMSGTFAGSSRSIVSAIDHVVELKKRWTHSSASTPAFMLSVSLGVKAPPEYAAVDAAISRAAIAGVIPVVAAGNGGHDACSFTPARAAGAITVGALNSDNRLAAFSNRGQCVLVAAPGEHITGASNTADTTYSIRSGTSTAVPYVTALIALKLGERPHLSPFDVVRGLTVGERVSEGIVIAKVAPCKLSNSSRPDRAGP